MSDNNVHMRPSLYVYNVDQAYLLLRVGPICIIVDNRQENVRPSVLSVRNGGA